MPYYSVVRVGNAYTVRKDNQTILVKVPTVKLANEIVTALDTAYRDGWVANVPVLRRPATGLLLGLG